jgi:PiT family inorganic phosphate transporter
MAPPITARYAWILAITTIAFVFSAFGNGANDVANAYASTGSPHNSFETGLMI